MVLCHQDLAFAIPFAERVFWKGEKPMDAFDNENKINSKYVDVLVPQPKMRPRAVPYQSKRERAPETRVNEPRVLRTPTLPPYTSLCQQRCLQLLTDISNGWSGSTVSNISPILRASARRQSSPLFSQLLGHKPRGPCLNPFPPTGRNYCRRIRLCATPSGV